MAELTIQSVDNITNVVTFAAADAAGDDFESTTDAIMVVKNGDVGPHTLTINPVTSPVNEQSVGKVVVAPFTEVIPAAGEAFVQVPDAYKGLRGRILMEYDDVTSVTVAVIRPGLAT